MSTFTNYGQQCKTTLWSTMHLVSPSFPHIPLPIAMSFGKPMLGECHFVGGGKTWKENRESRDYERHRVERKLNIFRQYKVIYFKH